MCVNYKVFLVVLNIYESPRNVQVVNRVEMPYILGERREKKATSGSRYCKNRVGMVSGREVKERGKLK